MTAIIRNHKKWQLQLTGSTFNIDNFNIDKFNIQWVNIQLQHNVSHLGWQPVFASTFMCGDICAW